MTVWNTDLLEYNHEFHTFLSKAEATPETFDAIVALWREANKSVQMDIRVVQDTVFPADSDPVVTYEVWYRRVMVGKYDTEAEAEEECRRLQPTCGYCAKYRELAEVAA